MPSKLLRRTLILVGATGIALGACELLFARYLPVDALSQAPDPVLLTRPIPGAHKVLVMRRPGGFECVHLSINARGFRGPLPREPAPPLRIGVFGDSFVMAENVSEEQSFPVRLERELSERLHEQVECINAGVTSYGPEQALLRYEEEAERLRPERVVLVLCATNDYGDLLRDKLFVLGPEGELVRQTPTLGPRVHEEFERRRQLAGGSALLRVLRESWENLLAPKPSISQDHALNPLIPLYLKSSRDEWVETAREGDTVVRNLFQDVYDADIAIHPEAEWSRYKMALMQKVLERWKASTAAQGAELFVVVVPSAIDLDPTFEVRVDTALYPTYDPARLSRSLCELAAAAGIPCLDLYPAFLEADPSTLFEGYLDFHWNAAGQALGARLTAERLCAALPSAGEPTETGSR